MNILTANISKMMGFTSAIKYEIEVNITSAIKYEVAYGLSISIFRFHLGLF